MFKFKPKRKSKAYHLRSDSQSIKIPLTFHGKSVELNSQMLGKGQYTLCSEDQAQNSRVAIMVL